MYFSAKYIDIKLKQDYADFLIQESQKTLVLADGIGEFPQSRLVAEFVVDKILEKDYTSIGDFLLKEDRPLFDSPDFKGGTTIIMAIQKNKPSSVKIEYLGNGGVIHLYGDFVKNSSSEHPYRYAEIMNPHISPGGALTKHISHDSGKMEHAFSKIELELRYPTGDILLFYTDGITSLEDKIIIKDNQGRFWRNEAPSVQFILNELHLFLKNNCKSEEFHERLIQFNIDILSKLNESGFLEDDASLGLIITEDVLNHYINEYL